MAAWPGGRKWAAAIGAKGGVSETAERRRRLGLLEERRKCRSGIENNGANRLGENGGDIK